eukprot:14335905-Ditylum_brightwellii.AAC.1
MLLEAARQGYLQGWPGLTQAAIRNQIDIEDTTVKGHLKQVRQGICSTQENTQSQNAYKSQKTTRPTMYMPQ